MYGDSLVVCVDEEEIILWTDTKQLQSPETDLRPQSL